MNNSLGYTDVWEILKKHKFPVDKIDAECLCRICGKIMINPHSVPCGCTYCLECIENYLGDEDKMCPGIPNKCKIISKKSVAINYQINNKISNLKVKCPEQSCKVELELSKMGEHIEKGKFQIINCPYQNIGCELDDITHDSIKDHLRSHEDDHIKMLMDVIDKNLKKNIENLKLQTGNLNNEVQEIKTTNGQNQDAFYELQGILNEKIQEIEVLKLTNQDFHRDIETLKTQNMDSRNILNGLSNEFQRNFEALRAENTELRNIINRLSERADNIEENHNYGEFIWKINNFNLKIQNARDQIIPQIISKPFYSHKNGYKLCLRLFPNGMRDEIGRSVSIFFNLMKGEYDDILSWPFEYDVTLSIINQHTMLPHWSHIHYFSDFKNKKNFEKPTNYMNEKGFGVYKLIELREILQNQHLIQNDQIFIKCVVDIK